MNQIKRRHASRFIPGFVMVFIPSRMAQEQGPPKGADDGRNSDPNVQHSRDSQCDRISEGKSDGFARDDGVPVFCVARPRRLVARGLNPGSSHPRDHPTAEPSGCGQATGQHRPPPMPCGVRWWINWAAPPPLCFPASKPGVGNPRLPNQTAVAVPSAEVKPLL